jgi:serine/threonine protein kinase
MPEHVPLGRTLSLSAARLHDQLCDKLEAGWRAGHPPRIEDLLAQVPADQQADLLAALLRVDLECRPEPPAPGEYQARFPQFMLLVENLLRDPAAETHGASPGELPLAPPSIPGYEILGRIGTGGMGVVYRARHVDLDRSVAIKTIKSGADCRQDELVRFNREARAVAALNLPGIVQLYAFGHVDGIPYYVMEFVDGGSLDDRLNGRPMDPAWSAGLIEQLAATLQYVHERGIVHRDLKPANVLLAGAKGPDTATVTPKIADFGLAKQLTGADPGLTKSRAVIGTACYMAPEQAAGKNKEVGKSADIYALGAILFELITGQPPFRAETYELTVAQVLTQEPPRPTELEPAVPADLEAICLKCLEKEPANRYPSAGELADDLRRWREGLPVQAGPLHVLDRDTRWAKRIGCEITDLLGCTRTAFLYTAVQTNIGRKVLLKLSTGRVGSPQHMALRRQAAALAGVDHPNVLRLLDYGEQYGKPYLILEYVEGGVTLSRLLRSSSLVADGPTRFEAETTRKPFPSTRAAEICLMLAIGLQEVHQNKVLHCGLHTGAVVLTRDGVPKIAGFEAARKKLDSGLVDLVPPPEIVPPNFVAPEMFSGRTDAVGPATDVYGIGAILYDLLTGVPPFLAGTAVDTRERVLHEPPIRPRDIEPSIPVTLEAICLKCLEKSSAHRFPKASVLALELQRFLRPPDPSGDSTVGPSDVARRDTSLDPSAVYRLRVLAGPAQSGATFMLPRQRVMIGRSKDCEVMLPGEAISRVHCGVLWNDAAGRHELMDYGSKNGSFVNRERLQGSRLLVPGDEIQISEYVLKFEKA